MLGAGRGRLRCSRRGTVSSVGCSHGEPRASHRTHAHNRTTMREALRTGVCPLLSTRHTRAPSRASSASANRCISSASCARAPVMSYAPGPMCAGVVGFGSGNRGAVATNRDRCRLGCRGDANPPYNRCVSLRSSASGCRSGATASLPTLRSGNEVASLKRGALGE